MSINKGKNANYYTTLLDEVLLLVAILRKEKRKSPTIAELALLIGDSEERILECLEFGKPLKLIH
ncbi:hypothetical protein JCM9140_761 [Halalkalibacter wakoensis JCM 9140]|uniref:Uncharacterized protein n=1 Tax=Halalkalibacter wakoensis JCM 9140 TaxID=1236970 RepID=W4Q0A2_9BACI|nr:hypothetical protein [Halalkalibacter wakoensis]GAE24809.1 hypothetical protein JCM9140_761 [Halalkalibacter wakoensis JCM 9140]